MMTEELPTGEEPEEAMEEGNPPTGDGGRKSSWSEYARLVLTELARHSTTLDALKKESAEGLASVRREIAEMREDHVRAIAAHNADIGVRLTQALIKIGKLEVRAGVWGMLGGLIPAVVTLAVVLLKRG
jgi:hypothetical protein